MIRSRTTVLCAHVIERIRQNATGEIREQPGTLNMCGGKPSAFIWADGNFGCDCNRGLFFARIGNDPDAEADHPCTWESPAPLYAAQIVNAADGSVIYDEFEATPRP